MIKKYLFFLLLFCVNTVFAQDIPVRPSPPRLVNDLASMMSSSESEDLENMLRNYNDSTSTQIAIVTIQTVGDYPISEVAVKILREWGIGSKKNNNGVLILTSAQERKIWISTGYGMEGALPDITCKRIIDEHIRPNFKNKNFYQGFKEAAESVILAARGEYNDKPVSSKKEIPAWIIILIIIIVIVVLSQINNTGGGGGLMQQGRGGTVFWGGGYNDWGGGGRGGGSSGGGCGGGGFDFGGGSGGGGGAGGDW